MTQCQCEQCSPGAVGETFMSAYRLACEAITMLGWSLEARRGFLDRVEKARGGDARRALEAAFLERWEAVRSRQRGGLFD